MVDRLVPSVLSRMRAMKPLAILIILGALYSYALLKTKSLFEGPNRIKICEYQFAHRTCGFLAQLGD
jgi:hypothetical protein